MEQLVKYLVRPHDCHIWNQMKVITDIVHGQHECGIKQINDTNNYDDF